MPKFEQQATATQMSTEIQTLSSHHTLDPELISASLGPVNANPIGSVAGVGRYRDRCR